MADIHAPIDREQTMLAAVQQYFVKADAGDASVFELFTDEVQIYFPKFGIATGKAAFGELAAGLLGSLKSIAHYPKNRIWPVPVWRRIGHFQWDDPGSTAYRRSPHG